MEEKLKKYVDAIENAITIGEKSKYLNAQEIVTEFPHLQNIFENLNYKPSLRDDEVVFLNKIASFDGINYLQTGVKWGIHLFSVLESNSPNVSFAIDDFGGALYANDVLKRFLSNKNFINLKDFMLIRENYFNVTSEKKLLLNNINLYFHNGNHNYSDQSKTLPYYYNVLDDVFIFMTDSWELETTKNGTQKAINNSNVTLVDKWVYNDKFFIGVFKK